jgi:phosphotransferase system IIB component
VINLSSYTQYIIIAIVILIILSVALKLNKKDFAIKENKLIGYLGGKDNIINASLSMSRFKVILRDVSLANKDAIQKLGAKGIVEIDNQLKIVFDKDAKQLKKYIDEIV